MWFPKAPLFIGNCISSHGRKSCLETSAPWPHCPAVLRVVLKKHPKKLFVKHSPRRLPTATSHQPPPATNRQPPAAATRRPSKYRTSRHYEADGVSVSVRPCWRYEGFFVLLKDSPGCAPCRPHWVSWWFLVTHTHAVCALRPLNRALVPTSNVWITGRMRIACLSIAVGSPPVRSVLLYRGLIQGRPALRNPRGLGCTPHIRRGGEHPPKFTVLGMTECEASPGGSVAGTPGG